MNIVDQKNRPPFTLSILLSLSGVFLILGPVHSGRTHLRFQSATEKVSECLGPPTPLRHSAKVSIMELNRVQFIGRGAVKESSGLKSNADAMLEKQE